MVKGKLLSLAAVGLFAGSAKAPAFTGVGVAPMGTTILPDSCGSDDVRFEVKRQKNPPPPGPPEANKAQIVLIESFIHNIPYWGSPATRVGMDGSWVGANRGNSYFALSVDPGEHHLCSDYQTPFGAPRLKAGLTRFTAEAGKIYYFETTVSNTKYSSAGPGSREWNLDLKQVDEDEGKYLVKLSALSISKPKG